MQTETLSSLSLLKFSDPNSKLRQLKEQGYRVAVFALPAAWTCPGANACKARVGRDGGLVDGPNVEFRCFAASMEARLKDLRKAHWFNLDLLKTCNTDVAALTDLICRSLPRNANAVRIHEAGDFYSKHYFLAWCDVARRNPNILFYAYTKSLRIWIENQTAVPSNLVLTASRGGLDDSLIDKHGLKTARVVFSIEQANKLGLAIDHDDTHAMDRDCREFALLIHNVQPKGSEASKALQALKGLGSYSSKTAVNVRRAQSVDAIAISA